MTSWYERRDCVDHYAPADLDELTEQLLTLVRPEPPYAGPRPCRICLADIEPGECCIQCGTVLPYERKAA